MDVDIIMAQLRELKLHGMAEAAKGLLLAPLGNRVSLEHAISELIEAENRSRDDKRTQRLLKAAKLKVKAMPETIKCSADRNLVKSDVDQLLTCNYVRRGENVLITGLTGCGKTYLACALGYQACLLGMKVLYLNMNHFIEDVRKEIAQGTVNQMMIHMLKIDLLIIDDFGLQTMDNDSRLAMLTLLDDRYEKKSVIIASQLPLDKWYEYIKEPTLADAILDRLFNGSHHLDLKGASMRRRIRT